MNLNELRYAIESSFVGCRTCNEPVDGWPEADPSEPGHKVIYVAREALFVGMCQQAHVNEFFLAEVKAEEIVAHDVTERTIGRFVSQEDCTHAKSRPFQLDAGETIRTAKGLVEGPASGTYCTLCQLKYDVEKGEKEQKSPSVGPRPIRRSGLIGLDGRPLNDSE